MRFPCAEFSTLDIMPKNGETKEGKVENNRILSVF
jgi:hypothetical protein